MLTREEAIKWAKDAKKKGLKQSEIVESLTDKEVESIKNPGKAMTSGAIHTMVSRAIGNVNRDRKAKKRVAATSRGDAQKKLDVIRGMLKLSTDDHEKVAMIELILGIGGGK